MNELKLKVERRLRRKKGIRKRVFGTADRPRLTVFRSLQNIYAQIIDDDLGRTIVDASTQSKELHDSVTYGGNKSAAATVGKLLAERAVAKGVTSVVMDRNGYRFHGRVKTLADAARKVGLKF